MFMGFRNSSGRCDSYGAANALLNKAMLTPTGKQRAEKTYGYTLGGKGEQRMIRKDANGAICLRLYDTDVVIYHSETCIEIDNTWHSKTTGEFASALSPFSCGALGSIIFARPERTGDDWRGYWSGASEVSGNVVFNLVDGAWVPDPTTGDTFHWVTLDRKIAREVAAKYHLNDFEMWASMAPMHIDGLEHFVVESSGQSYDRIDRQREAVATNLLARDFRAAFEHVPPVELKEAYGRYPTALNIACRSGYGVTATAVARIRTWLYAQAGAYSVESAKIMKVGDLANKQKRNSDVVKAGADFRYDTGWSAR